MGNLIRGLIKRKDIEKEEDKYGLTKSVQITDVKGYLQKEYERATERENLIQELEAKLDKFNELQLKYDAMLVVQQETQKRIERQDENIKEYRERIYNKDIEIKEIKAKQIDIKINAEKKLKQKDAEIKELKKQIKDLTKPNKKKKG